MLKRVSLGGRVRVWAENHRSSSTQRRAFFAPFGLLLLLAEFLFEELVLALAHGGVARVVYCGFLAVEAPSFLASAHSAFFACFAAQPDMVYGGCGSATTASATTATACRCSGGALLRQSAVMRVDGVRQCSFFASNAEQW